MSLIQQGGNVVFITQLGMIQAITNRQVGLKGVLLVNASRVSNSCFSVITELIVVYMLPGRPIAMMMFKVCQ